MGINYQKAKQVIIYKKARELFSRIGKKVFFNNNERIYVNNTDIKESVSKTIINVEQKRLIKENIVVFAKLDEIIENAIEISSSEKDNKGRKEYSSYKYYVSNAMIDGKPFVIEFDTRIQFITNKKERHFRLERIYSVQKRSFSDRDD